jgi:hypothetical protein
MKKFILFLVSIVFVALLGFTFKSEDPIKDRSISDNKVTGNSVVIGTPSDARFSGGYAAQTFEGNFPPQGCTIINGDGSITFDAYTGANGPTFGGQTSVFMDFYSYSTTGQRDYLLTPVMTNIISTDSVTFDYAYAQYPGYSDSLIVTLSTDNGVTFPVTLFRKGGASLATAPATSNQFVPTASQWATVTFSLSAYAGSSVKLKFETYNGYGNELYIDNIAIGTRSNIDVAAGTITNIRPDTSYSTGTSTFKIAPVCSFANLGLTAVSNVPVTLKTLTGGYISNKTISLAAGEGAMVTFDSLTITPGSAAMNFVLFCALSTDQNKNNDTAGQFSNIFAGTVRKVMFHEFTSATCSPCASNNPYLDAFLAPRYDSVVAIKYHMNWPSPGNDPMYLANSSQNTERRTYYSVNAVPTLFVEGRQANLPFSQTSNLSVPYYNRKAVGTPYSISVTDTRLQGDSIQSTIVVTVLAPLQLGNYKMRVEAVERRIDYASAPGSNGEKTFYDVFRRAYPTTAGVAAPVTPGTYQYVYKYKKEAAWVDSMIYTAVWIQNDINKEVMGSDKGHFTPIGIQNIGVEVPVKFDLSQNYPNPFNPVTNIKFSIAKSTFATLAVYDITGRIVKEFNYTNLAPGYYKLDIDMSAMSSGVYFYQLKTNTFLDTKRMVLVK